MEDEEERKRPVSSKKEELKAQPTRLHLWHQFEYRSPFAIAPTTTIVLCVRMKCKIAGQETRVQKPCVHYYCS